MLIMRSLNTARKTSFSGFSDYGLNIKTGMRSKRRSRYLSGYGQDTAWDVLNTNLATPEGGQTINYPNDSSYPSPSDVMQEQFPISTVATQPVSINESSYPSGEEVLKEQMPVSSGSGLCDGITCQAQGGACNSSRTQCVQPYVSTTSNAPGAIQIPRISVPIPIPTRLTTPAATPNPTPGLLNTITNLITRTLSPSSAGATVGGLPYRPGYISKINPATGQAMYYPVTSTGVGAQPSSLSSILPFILMGGVGIVAIILLKR